MNFFVTGDGSVKTNLNLKFLTPEGSRGANFSADGQTLSQSLSIAQSVFGRVARGKIDFVLIGLSPDCLFQGDVDENLSALTEYLKLCGERGAKPVCVIFPVAPTARDVYRKRFAEPLREILAALKNLCDFELIDLFDVPFPEEVFADEKIFTPSDAPFLNVVLTFKLYEQEIFSFADFCRMSYGYFDKLSYTMSKEIFQSLMDEIFRVTVAELKRKDKIKIAFVTDHAAMWCGDELYNLFAGNPRFETTVFMCRVKESTLNDAIHDFEQFQARGLNVVGVFDFNAQMPPQDVVIFLRPYVNGLPKGFQADAMTPRTLWTHILYGFKLTYSAFEAGSEVFRLAWKIFFETEHARKFFDEKCQTGVPRGFVSGYPKLDVFFEDIDKFSFPWKMARPDAKKIIWAPHWSFEREAPINFSTFNRNYKFMYEFAKSHPETSWVVKPHPHLLYSAVNSRLFPSVAAYKEYLRAWNDLPNAQVFTGAYYQEIFATSDGMIQDSGSFIAEYQYTHKPMIYLTRTDSTKFNELAEKILSVNYCVDGSDFEGIAALMQKVFIEGNDPLKAERQKVFDELLNYRRVNGMSASEFIYRSIADELEAI